MSRTFERLQLLASGQTNAHRLLDILERSGRQGNSSAMIAGAEHLCRDIVVLTAGEAHSSSLSSMVSRPPGENQVRFVTIHRASVDLMGNRSPVLIDLHTVTTALASVTGEIRRVASDLINARLELQTMNTRARRLLGGRSGFVPPEASTDHVFTLLEREVRRVRNDNRHKDEEIEELKEELARLTNDGPEGPS